MRRVGERERDSTHARAHTYRGKGREAVRMMDGFVASSYMPSADPAAGPPDAEPAASAVSAAAAATDDDVVAVRCAEL